MKQILFVFLSTLLVAGNPCRAAISPSTAGLAISCNPHSAFSLRSPKPARVTPSHLNFFQRLEWKLLQKRITRQTRGGEGMTEKQRHWATVALITGIASLVLLFVPYLALVALPAAIVGLIFGIKSVKGNSNIKGIVGIATSGTTILLFLIAVILAAVFLATWF